MRMPHVGKILRYCLGGILLLCAPSVLPQIIVARVNYTVLYSPIDVTEPVLLKLEFANLTDKDLELNFGWRDQIYFTATGPSGRMEIHEPAPTSFDQVSRLGEMNIAPKGIYSQEIVLSRWASFAAPGDYTIELHLHDPLGFHSAESLQIQTESVKLLVEPSAPSLLQRHCIEEWGHLKEAHNGREAMDAALFLGNVGDPFAVSFMSAGLDTEHAAAIGGVLIAGLERIGNLSAVQALAVAMNGRNTQNAQAAHDALTKIAVETTIPPDVAKNARLALDRAAPRKM